MSIRVYGTKQHNIGKTTFTVKISARDLDDYIVIPNAKSVGIDDAAQRNQAPKRIQSLFRYVICGLCLKVEIDESNDDLVRNLAREIRLENAGQREIFLIPSMIGVTKFPMNFELICEESGTEFGYLEFDEMPILESNDGGHRTLALIRAGQMIKHARKNGSWPKANFMCFSSEYSGRKLSEELGEVELVKQLERHYNKLETDWIVVTDCNVNEARQLFFDVNENTQKPGKQYLQTFDRSKPFNALAQDLFPVVENMKWTKENLRAILQIFCQGQKDKDAQSYRAFEARGKFTRPFLEDIISSDAKLLHHQPFAALLAGIMYRHQFESLSETEFLQENRLQELSNRLKSEVYLDRTKIEKPLWNDELDLPFRGVAVNRKILEIIEGYL